ncbi:MAG: phospholipid/glycerol acyltransferase [Gemmatimonadetes bacterium]|nr:phospholipid/glycerol acyltransferase [Gemmatimonadota bacterium]
MRGWQISGAIPAVPKCIIIVAPHTSNWDFPLGVAAMFALDLDAHWFGKNTLFWPPFGWLLRHLGGRPVRRDTAGGVVEEMTAIVRAEPTFLLALAPEGTRKPVARWRSGFYRIAEAADVPVVPVAFDWSTKTIWIMEPFRVTGNLPADMRHLRSFYRSEMGRDPTKFVAS